MTFLLVNKNNYYYYYIINVSIILTFFIYVFNLENYKYFKKNFKVKI